MSRTEQLTIYLIKDTVRHPEAIISKLDTLQEHEVRVGEMALGQLYVKSSRRHLPRWTGFFEPALNPGELGCYSSGSSAVLLVRASSRMFALTFGYGRHLLEPGVWEERFGLKVTLNSINPRSLRSIDKKSFDAISVHSRQQTSQEVTASEFGLDSEQDLLRAVTGKPDDASLGTRLTGMDALSVSVKVGLAGLWSLLGKYLDAYGSTAYRDTFPWVDQIAELTNTKLREQLDDRLVETLQAGGSDQVWLAVPDLLEWNNVAGFRYTESKRQPLLDDIHVTTFLGTLRDPSRVSMGTLRQRKAYCFSTASDLIIGKWPVYECLYFETDLDGETFLLSGGRWYRVERDFVATLDDFVGKLRRVDDELPSYEDENEAEYNARAAAANADYALMDQNLVARGRGQTPIEFCDLFSKDGRLIHVKRYGGSSVLSHLFAQGLTSIELFLTDSVFRAKLNEKLPSTHRLEDPDRTPEPSDYEIVFGIISKSKRELRLPLFSKINLRHAAKRIGLFRVRLAVARIKNDRVGTLRA